MAFKLALFALFLGTSAHATLPLGDLSQPPTNHLTPSVIARKNAQALVPEVLNALRWYGKQAKRESFSMSLPRASLQDLFTPRDDEYDTFIDEYITHGKGAYLGHHVDPTSLACLFDALEGPDRDLLALDIAALYPQLPAKIAKARIGLPACTQPFQAPPSDIQLTTNLPKPNSIFEELLEYYDRGVQPTVQDLIGKYEARCYFAENPNQPAVVTLSGSALTSDGGPKFTETALARVVMTDLNYAFSPSYDNIHTYDFGRLAQDESLSSGEWRVKKYDRYLVLKRLWTHNIVGGYHAEADPDASVIPLACYAWTPAPKEQP